MKTLLACALLVLVPLSSLRMVCLEASGASGPARQRVAAGTASAAPELGGQCERICLRHPAALPQRAAAATCVLVPNPQCAFVASPGVAIMPRAPVVLTAYGANGASPARRWTATSTGTSESRPR
jgi:hypothetical protein